MQTTHKKKHVQITRVMRLQVTHIDSANVGKGYLFSMMNIAIIEIDILFQNFSVGSCQYDNRIINVKSQ